MLLPAASVSVCVPVRRGERALAETIGSVLEQTYRDLELVVLDSAGADETAEVVQSLRDPRLRLERVRGAPGQADHWNRAVQAGTAPLVKVVRTGDLLHPRCLELQVGPMDLDPGLAVVAGRWHLVDGATRVVVPRRGLGGLTGVRSGVEVARRVVRSGTDPIGGPGSVLFRREDFLAAGGWRADLGTAQELDLWLRLLQFGEFLGLPETLAAARLPRRAPGADDHEALVEELCATDFYQVRGLDRAVGRARGQVRRKPPGGHAARAA
jgi:hypothetical protein